VFDTISSPGIKKYRGAFGFGPLAHKMTNWR